MAPTMLKIYHMLRSSINKSTRWMHGVVMEPNKASTQHCIYIFIQYVDS